MPDTGIDWSAVEKEAVDILSRYLQINTTNPPGYETAGALFLKGFLEKEKIPCAIYESMPGRGSLISAYSGDTGKPDIMLLHHIDVVPAEEKKWSQPPFSGAVIDGEIWGRGAVDCKSLGIMELMAFILLKRQGLRPERHIVYAATADEEEGGAWGVKWLMDTYPEKLSTRYVINEGVGLGFSTATHTVYFCQVAEKGSCWTRIFFKGNPGHGSVPHDANCVVEMSRAIEALSQYQFPVFIAEPVKRFIGKLAAVQDFMGEDEFMGLLDARESSHVLEKIPYKALRQILAAEIKNTAVPTVVHGGSKTNVIPGECYCEVDCRILPGSTPGGLAKTIDEILKGRGCKNFTVEVAGSLSSESSVETPLYRALEAGFRKHDPRALVVPYMSPGATDSRFFRAKGIPAYGVQMGASLDSIERIHGHNERISIKELTLGIKILYDVIKNFCFKKESSGYEQ